VGQSIRIAADVDSIHKLKSQIPGSKWKMSDIPAILPEHHKLLSLVAAQLMNGTEVVLENQRSPIAKVGVGRLRRVQFLMNGRAIIAIEQNRQKTSRWGQLARKGHQVVQFQDLVTRKYLAAVVDGEVFEYGKT